MVNGRKLNCPRYYTDDVGNRLFQETTSEIWCTMDSLRLYLEQLEAFSISTSSGRKAIIKHIDDMYDRNNKRSPIDLVESCLDGWLRGKYVHMTNPVYIDLFMAMKMIVSSAHDGSGQMKHFCAYQRYKMELKAKLFHDGVGVCKTSDFEDRFNLVPV